MAKKPAAPIEAPAIVNVPKNGRTVCVACKVPQGIRLQLQHPMKRRMPKGLGGDNDYEETMFNVFGGQIYNCFGPAIPAMGGVPDGYVMPPDIKGGYAFTPGIPVDFWEQWLKQNAQADYVLNHMVFALPAMADAKIKAVSHEAEKSGLEPVSREIDEKTGMLKDRRVPKPINQSLSRIMFDQERSARQQSSE
jgi:hypothetical protein